MSDIPSGALDAGESKAVSLLARVILPRPGEPLDVRKLYIEESETNARRAHAPTRTTLEIGAESEVSFATYFNAFPASYWRRWSTLESVVLRVELTGSARVDVYRSKATGARITVGGAPVSSETGGTATESDVGGPPPSSSRSASTRSRTAAGSGSTSPPISQGHRAQRRLVCRATRARTGQRRRRHPDVQPAGGLRQRASSADVGSLGGQSDRCGDRVRSGHQEGQGPPGVRRQLPPHWATGCRCTTNRTSAAPAATAG